jgi:hypothetical protein
MGPDRTKDEEMGGSFLISGMLEMNEMKSRRAPMRTFFSAGVLFE